MVAIEQVIRFGVFVVILMLIAIYKDLGTKIEIRTIHKIPTWVPDPNVRYSNEDPNTGRCVKEGRGKNLYTWDDDSLLPFSRDTFCDTIKDYRQVLFIGDSLIHGMFMSLSLLLGTDYKLIAGIKIRFFTNVTVCGDKRLVYVRNDDLAERPTQRGSNKICKNFKSELQKSDVVVVNRGIHYSPINDVMRDLKEFFGTIDYSRQKLFYRTSVAGHPNCDQILTPFLEDQPQPPLTKKELGWHWDRMDYQNDVVLGYLSTNHPSVSIIDIVHETKLRGDLHIGGGDCLHYCLPGPMDHWNRVFMNKLKLAI